MKRAGSKARRLPRTQQIKRQIVQIIPADPRWHALYDECGELAMMPLACFALVEARERGEAPMRFVCPMVVHGDGVIEDVHYSDGFVDLIPPCEHARANTHTQPGDVASTEPMPNGEVHS